MKQFISPAKPDKNGKLTFWGKDFHYLAHVRRVKTGDAIKVVLPDGGSAETVVTSIKKTCVELSVKNLNLENENLNDLYPPIFLLQALPKGSKMNTIIRQAAECGAAAIVPFEAAHSIKHTKSSTNIERWQRIIREARQQSGSKIATNVYEPLLFDGLFTFLTEWRKQNYCGKEQNITCILLHTEDGCKPMHLAIQKECALAILAVGPEGGFSAQEVKRFIEEGFVPVSLGDSIFRTESAAIAGLVALKLLLLERDSWKLVNV